MSSLEQLEQIVEQIIEPAADKTSLVMSSDNDVEEKTPIVKMETKCSSEPKLDGLASGQRRPRLTKTNSKKTTTAQ
jgi:hypothetical protein